MELTELQQLVDLSIEDCQQIINQNPKVILSEGDFEKLLSECISKRIGYVKEKTTPDSFAVYTQISHYNDDTDKNDARVDILLMKPDNIVRVLNKNKDFYFKSNESIAIELKYQHAKNEECVKKVNEDIDKVKKYYNDSYYYVIALLDENEDTEKYKNDILKYYESKKKEYEKNNNYKDKFFCCILTKKEFKFKEYEVLE